MEKRISDPRFLVQKSAPDIGHGLFARVPIETGDFILEYTGVRIPTKLADEMKSRYLFELDPDWTVDGEVPENLARYINHSCEPNCECQLEDGKINIYAARDIEPGEELSFDYGQEYFDEFIKPFGCKCPACSEQKTVNSEQFS